ncbi:hypothetical protein PROFUN_07171 [Planoprotostelium fungivorum]|uniref:DUF4773 domain-containing protein n=1 Tax=Planoprotostelium fungivorum TaxID=1890364 RepID=A0A2P6NMB3_9EUKA|nr:hypothetical protein PROFUN_07171 [Planoprotostelium fungivorum]
MMRAIFCVVLFLAITASVDSACSCSREAMSCSCCEPVVIDHVVHYNGSLCAEMDYLPAKMGVSLLLKAGSWVIVNKTFSLDEPSFCGGIGIDGFSGCVDFTDMKYSLTEFAGCVAVEVDVLGYKAVKTSLGCFDLKNPFVHTHTTTAINASTPMIRPIVAEVANLIFSCHLNAREHVMAVKLPHLSRGASSFTYSVARKSYLCAFKGYDELDRIQMTIFMAGNGDRMSPTWIVRARGPIFLRCLCDFPAELCSTLCTRAVSLQSSVPIPRIVPSVFALEDPAVLWFSCRINHAAELNMRASTSIIIIILISCLCVGSTAQNTTELDCAVINPKCDGRGVCSAFKICRCFTTFSGFTPYDCKFDLKLIPGNAQKMQSSQYYQGALFIFVFLLTAYRVGAEVLYDRTASKETSLNSCKWTLGWLLVYCIMQLIMCGDYWGVEGNLPIPLYHVLFYYKECIFLFIYSAILSHWISLHYVSLRRLKKEEMLKKIKPGYTGSVSLEEMMIQMQKLSRFKIAYMVVSGFSILTVTIHMIITFQTRYPKAYDTMALFEACYFIIAWILFAAGFVYYGVKLMRILPDGISYSMKIAITSNIIFLVGAIGVQIFNIILNRRNDIAKQMNVSSFFATITLEWICCMATLNIHMPLHQYHLWFNPKLIKKLLSSLHSTGDTGSETRHDSNELPMDISECMVDSDDVIKGEPEVVEIRQDSMPRPL